MNGRITELGVHVLLMYYEDSKRQRGLFVAPCCLNKACDIYWDIFVSFFDGQILNLAER